MAPRINKIRHDEETRLRIQVAKIIDGLHAHFDGTRELTNTQLKAAQLLLDRALPTLQTVQHSGEITTSYVARIPNTSNTAEAWERKHNPVPLQ